MTDAVASATRGIDPKIRDKIASCYTVFISFSRTISLFLELSFFDSPGLVSGKQHIYFNHIMAQSYDDNHSTYDFLDIAPTVPNIALIPTQQRLNVIDNVTPILPLYVLKPEIHGVVCREMRMEGR